MSEHRESTRSYALLAGVGCYFLAFLVLIALPFWLSDQAIPQVRGEDGVVRKVEPYTPREASGREVYGKQVCWHCHMQYIRPVNDEDLRWGPVSQAGEYAYDVPHFFGTRRIGPDLHREGLTRVDDWHLAHLWDPRAVVKRSVMPSFPWLFYEHEDADRIRHLISRLDTNGDGMISKLGDDPSDPTEEIAALRREARLARFDRWGVESPQRVNESSTGRFLRWEQTGDGILTDHDARPMPTEEALDVVAYLQRLGTTIGPWLRPVNAGAPSRTSPFVAADGSSLQPPRRPKAMNVHGFLRDDPAKVKAADEARVKWQGEREEWARKNPGLEDRLRRGKELYDTHCASCHGDEGRGNGLGAQHLQIRPRDFAIAKYKWRSTRFGRLPLDGDIFRTIVRGLPGTAMPSWRQIPEERVWLLVDYVKTFYEGDQEFDDVSQVDPVPPEYVPTKANLEKHLARGRAVYMSALCYNCHGLEGKGDGPGWKDAAGDYGGLLRPRDLPRRHPDDRTELRLRGGATAQDLYRTIMTGIDGTQMVPQFDTFFTRKPVKPDSEGFDLKRSEQPSRVTSNASLPKNDPKRRLVVAFQKKTVDGVEKDVFLDDPALKAVGVTVEDVSGTQREVIYLEEADDWALVHYVMSLADIPIRTK